jgi:small neutral amino acid transporter SnatA (MarC family)
MAYQNKWAEKKTINFLEQAYLQQKKNLRDLDNSKKSSTLEKIIIVSGGITFAGLLASKYFLSTNYLRIAMASAIIGGGSGMIFCASVGELNGRKRLN